MESEFLWSSHKLMPDRTPTGALKMPPSWGECGGPPSVWDLHVEEVKVPEQMRVQSASTEIARYTHTHTHTHTQCMYIVYTCTPNGKPLLQRPSCSGCNGVGPLLVITINCGMFGCYWCGSELGSHKWNFNPFGLSVVELSIVTQFHTNSPIDDFDA